MARQSDRRGLLRPCLVAVGLVCCWPDGSRAENLVFRNECTAPVVVQAVSVFRGVIRRDKPYLLNPGDMTPAIALPGGKVITVYEAKAPNRILFQGSIPARLTDIHFGVVPDVLPGRVRLEVRRPPPPPKDP